MENYYVLIELIFSGAVIMGLGLWQLISVRREIAKDRAKARLVQQNSTEMR